MESLQSAGANVFFNRQWQTYQRVLSFNYMFHRELAQMVRAYLVENFREPYSLLDLGCGDAGFTVQAVAGTPLHNYVGVDLSATALNVARSVMNGTAEKSVFSEGDLIDVVAQLRSTSQTFDVVLASYSLHHLDFEKKNALFSDIADMISPDGMFLMADLVRRPGEQHEEFLDRYTGWVESDWTALEREEIVSINEHIRASDFPETPETIERLAQAHGLQMRCLHIAPQYTEALFSFRAIPSNPQ